MDIRVKDLRDKPEINFFVRFKWMSKLTPTEIERWERELVDEFLFENEEMKRSEIIFRITKEAELIERDYNFLII